MALIQRLATGGMLACRFVVSKFGPVVEVVGSIGLAVIGLGILDHTGVIG